MSGSSPGLLPAFRWPMLQEFVLARPAEQARCIIILLNLYPALRSEELNASPKIIMLLLYKQDSLICVSVTAQVCDSSDTGITGTYNHSACKVLRVITELITTDRACRSVRFWQFRSCLNINIRQIFIKFLCDTLQGLCEQG